jgi:hypothetical protein
MELAGKNLGDDSVDRALWSREGIVAAGLTFSPDESHLTAILYKSTPKTAADRLSQRVIVIEADSGKTLLDVSELRPLALSFRSDNRSVVVLSHDIQGGRYLIKIHDVGAQSVAFEKELRINFAEWRDVFLGASADGRYIALQTWNAAAKESYLAWEVDTGESVEYSARDFTWSGGGISPNGELLACGGWPGPGIRVGKAHLGAGRGRTLV